MKTCGAGLLLEGADQSEGGGIHDMAEWLARSQDYELAGWPVMEKTGAEPPP